MRRAGLLLFVLVLAARVPQASAIITLDAVYRWVQRITTCVCLSVSMVCAVLVYNYIWVPQPEDDGDDWDDWEAEQEAARAEARNRTRMEKLRLQQEEYDRQQKLEMKALALLGNGTNCSVVNELRVEMNRSEYRAFVMNLTGNGSSDGSNETTAAAVFVDPCPFNWTNVTDWAARMNFKDETGPCAKLNADQQACSRWFVDAGCIDPELLEVDDDVENEWELCMRLPRPDLIERCAGEICSQLDYFYSYYTDEPIMADGDDGSSSCAPSCQEMCRSQPDLDPCVKDCMMNSCPEQAAEMTQGKEPAAGSAERTEEAREGPRTRRRLQERGSMETQPNHGEQPPAAAGSAAEGASIFAQARRGALGQERMDHQAWADIPEADDGMVETSMASLSSGLPPAGLIWGLLLLLLYSLARSPARGWWWKAGRAGPSERTPWPLSLGESCR